jgi:aminopeptidase N
MIAAHETAHQWWYALVGNDQALEPWLDESLATYSELLFYENTVPDSSDWWWQYRVNYFNPHGSVNQSTADFKEFRPYINAVYLRGAHFWGDVRRAMGDDNFFAFLRAYAAQYGGKLADTNAVLNMIQQFGNPDLQKVMVRYFQ